MIGKTFGSALLVLGATVGSPALGAEEGPLGLADLPAYQAALSGRDDPSQAPLAVTFRALWDHPETYQGRRVTVTGQIVRRFQQGAHGVFPPLCETWIVSPANDPLCLVFPAAPGAATSRLGNTVRFTGTYLRRLEYQGGDGPRLAPLIAGEGAPVVTTPALPSAAQAQGALSATDWTLGLAASATVIVALLLVPRHLRRPPRRPLGVEVAGPDPSFIEPLPRNGTLDVEWKGPSESHSG